MSIGEYYKRLDLPETASPDEIKRAYRRLRAKYHPDLNKGREASVEPVFKRIQEAFEVLTGTRAAAPGASTGAAAQGRGRPAGARQGHAAPAQSHPQNGAQKGSQAGAQAHSRDAYAGHSAWAAAGR
ncbi:MAG TPA: DnaJ domain-containing protein, partial [Paraburkholderia sp.]|nr:DnaJ domain-containing protein [Paraburkholderia sp.]